MNFKIYSGTVTDACGNKRSLRFMHTAEEHAGHEKAGVLPEDTSEVIGMQDHAQMIEAGFEMQNLRLAGVALQ